MCVCCIYPRLPIPPFGSIRVVAVSWPYLLSGGRDAAEYARRIWAPRGALKTLCDKLDINVIMSHLEAKDGLRLDTLPLPRDLEDRHAIRAILAGEDAGKLILWHTLRQFTTGHTCKLIDLPDRASVLNIPCSGARVGSFLDGNSEKEFRPLNLRSAVGMEILLATNNCSGENDFLIIDGNHRLMAQWVAEKRVDGVPAFVIVHPQALSLGSVETHYKRLVGQ